MRFAGLMLCVSMMTACGDKVPESRSAREIGNVPRQAVDRATTGVDSAIQQGAERIREEEKKQ